MKTNEISYRNKYVNTYIWHSLSILTGLISLFVVVPFLSSNKIIYGIYSVCTSLTIFFSYADLGFLAAAQKYGSEYYAQGDTSREIRVISFVSYLMTLVFSILCLTILVMTLYPKLLIPELIPESEEYKIARILLLILCFSSFIMLAQRILITIYSIRIESYKFQRIATVGSLLKILSCFYFFSDGKYAIIPYYLFFQLINLVVSIWGIFGLRHYGYSLKTFLKCYKFDKEQFNVTKDISIVSFVATLCMIIYYELDSVVISHTLGVQNVAVYSVALTLLSFVRTYTSLIYSPYNSRYNHYVGENNNKGLLLFMRKTILVFDSVFIVPIITLSLLAQPFIISWVGEAYRDSSTLVSFLLLSFTPNFLSSPITSYLYAKERSKELLKWNVITPIVYWIGIFLTINQLGLLSFAIFKCLSLIVCTIAFFILVNRDYKKENITLISTRQAFFHVLIPLVACIGICYTVRPFMFYEQNDISLFYNILIICVSILLTFIISMFCNSTLRITLVEYLKAFHRY